MARMAPWSGQIASEHMRWQPRRWVRGRDVGAISLVVHKKEELLFEDGAGEVDTKLIELQGHFRARREVIPGVESVVAQEFKNSAMKVIGSGLGDDIHLRPERETALRAVAAIGEVDLLTLSRLARVTRAPSLPSVSRKPLTSPRFATGHRA